MAFDPENPKDIADLCDRCEWSAERLKYRRERRKEQMRRLVGPYYGDDGSENKRPVNMLELGVSIFQRGIASHSPQAMAESPYEDFLPSAADLELALNQELDRINIKDAFNTVGIEALFVMGSMKVGITTKETPSDGEGAMRDPGHVFADPVLFEDRILDMSAKRRDQMEYEGDAFTVPFPWVKDNPLYDKKARDEIQTPDDEGSDADIDTDTLSRGQQTDDGQKILKLRQVFLPREKLLLTLQSESTKLPLQVIEWDGPEHGPYWDLCFGKVPGNLIPMGLVPFWYDLDDIINKCFNKSMDQAERQKSILLVPGGLQRDGETIVNANDGEAYACEDPKSAVEMSYGGANQQTLGMGELAKRLLVWIGGNWEVLAGLAPQSRTVGQDEILAQNASGRVKDMQQTMIEFQTGVIRDLAFWLWTDPVSEYHFIKEVADTGFGLATRWTPENRMGNFFDYNIKVNPYSAQNRSPSEQAQAFLQIVMQVLLPADPMLQQQGLAINWEYVIKTLSKLMHLPELHRAIIYSKGEQIPRRGAVQPHMPSATQRTYVRENRSTATESGQDAVLTNLLFGGNSQESQMAGLMQSAG